MTTEPKMNSRMSRLVSPLTDGAEHGLIPRLAAPPRPYYRLRFLGIEKVENPHVRPHGRTWGTQSGSILSWSPRLRYHPVRHAPSGTRPAKPEPPALWQIKFEWIQEEKLWRRKRVNLFCC